MSNDRKREEYARDELKILGGAVWTMRVLVGLLLAFLIFALFLLAPG